jgi:hypothetical protein
MEFSQHRRHLLLGLTGLIFTPAFAARESRQARKKRCDGLKTQMKRLQSRLRRGYSAKAGRRYRQKLRELELQRYRRCR